MTHRAVFVLHLAAVTSLAASLKVTVDSITFRASKLAVVTVQQSVQDDLDGVFECKYLNSMQDVEVELLCALLQSVGKQLDEVRRAASASDVRTDTEYMPVCVCVYGCVYVCVRHWKCSETFCQCYVTLLLCLQSGIANMNAYMSCFLRFSVDKRRSKRCRDACLRVLNHRRQSWKITGTAVTA
jgi:hypothetical protein